MAIMHQFWAANEPCARTKRNHHPRSCKETAVRASGIQNDPADEDFRSQKRTTNLAEPIKENPAWQKLAAPTCIANYDPTAI